MRINFLKLMMLIALLTGYSSSIFSHSSSSLNDLPVSFQGRYRPAAAYAKLWLHQLREEKSLKNTKPNHSPPGDNTALTQALLLHFLGEQPFNQTPPYHPTKQEVNIQTERAMELLVQQLARIQTPPQQIDLQIENTYPLAERLLQVDTDWLALPSFTDPTRWHSLKALKLKIYDPNSQQLVPISNFTAYPDNSFEEIRKEYLKLEQAVIAGTNQGEADRLATSLIDAYETLALERNRLSPNSFPSLIKLKAENFYYNFPFTLIAIAAYSLAAFLFILYRYRPSKSIKISASAAHICAFIVQSCCLALRCYILSRPPVSNMFETLIFVPWIAVLSSYILYAFIRTQTVLIASAIASSILLTLLHWSQIDHSLENVQPVLDSHYWLIIHVLMVVGSYGVFVLAGLLGHLYIIYYHFQGNQSNHLELIGKLIIQSMFLGTALLIPGTILGGVWAAQSWGRFWDWDPKESWAFISSCTYLIWIHAYVFKKIHYFGVAIGSIVGLMMIGFTWYGVNYILGTGLHSYGFGEGGLSYFLVYLIAELIFLVFFSRSRYNKRPSTGK